MENSESPPSHKQPDHALAAVLAMRRLADKLERKAVVEAINQGWTWSKVADALGISKQAAHKKYAALVKAQNPKLDLAC